MTAGEGSGVAAGAFTPKVIAQFLTVTAIWGSTWIVIRSQLGAVPPSWSVAYRFLIAGTILLGYCLLRPSMRAQLFSLGFRGHGFALIVALMQFSLNFNLVYRAQQHLTSGLVSLLFALLIVPNALFGWALLGQRVTLRFAIGSLIGITGVALMFARDLMQPDGHSALVLTGLAFGGASILCASIGNVLQATQAGRAMPLESLLALSMFYGALINCLFALLSVGAPVFELTPAYVGGLLYLALVASVVAFSLYYSLLRSIGPARAAYTGVVIPVLAMGLSTLFENYVWSPLAWAGVALALVGMVIALRGRTPATRTLAVEAESIP